MASLTTEGFLMGGQYGKVGACLVVLLLLATSLGLSVIELAPVVHAGVVPMVVNIGLQGITGNAT